MKFDLTNRTAIKVLWVILLGVVFILDFIFMGVAIDSWFGRTEYQSGFAKICSNVVQIMFIAISIVSYTSVVANRLVFKKLLSFSVIVGVLLAYSLIFCGRSDLWRFWGTWVFAALNGPVLPLFLILQRSIRLGKDPDSITIVPKN